MQFRRIVIGVDFTEASLAAARWAALQFAADAEVVLVHALPASTGPSYLHRYLPDPVEVSASAAATFYGGLRGLAGLIGAERTRIYMAADRPADALAAVASQFDADLVCVGRGTRRRGSARFGATTAQRLLARTRVPTVVVPSGSHAAPSRIVAALDERPGAEVVLHAACRLAAAFEARVDAVHVLDGDVQVLAATAREIALAARAASDDYDDGAPRFVADAAPVLDAALLHDEARAWVAAALDGAGAAPGRSTPIVRAGDPGSRLVAHARQSRADLLVLGRGDDRSGAQLPARALPVGSNTRLVAWAAPCPVLVIPLDGSVGGDATTRARSAPNERLP